MMESLVKEGSIGAVLFRSRMITEEDIRAALEEQAASGCRFGEALVRLGVVTQEDIDWALSNQLDIPFVHLSEEIIDREAVRLVPAETARRHDLIPIIRTDNELRIALADPLNRGAVREVEQLTGCVVTVSIASLGELREMLDRFYGPARGAGSFGFASAAFSDAILGKINADLTGTRLVEYLMVFFLRNGITSLSLRPAGNEVRVTARRGKLVRELGRYPAASHFDLLNHLRKMAGIRESRHLTAEGGITYRYRESNAEFRVFLVKAVGGECITLKAALPGTSPARIEELGLSPEREAVFRSLAAPGGGVVLVASRNRSERSLLMDLLLDGSVEVPGSLVLVGEDIGRGRRVFPRINLPGDSPEEMEILLDSLADHEPEVIALEEATDGRTFLAAWKAAMGDCLVVGGVSCSGLAGALDYLISARHINPLVAHGIRGITAVTQMRTLCPDCREDRPAPERDGSLPEAGQYFRPTGCAACGYTGFGGTRYLVEALSFGPDLREAFSRARTGDELLRHLAAAGYRGVADELADALRNGEISPEEYLAITNH